MGMPSFYRVALFGASVQALAFPGPRPTDNINFHAIQEGGWTPKPTPGPEPHQVLRRQNGFASSYLLAPDNTCGYFGGSSKSAYGCDISRKCAIIPAVGKVDGAAGCCAGNDCSFRVSCVDKDEMDDCDKQCQSDAMTLKCTGAAKFCNTVGLNGVINYYCSSKKVSTVQKADTTYSGQKGRTLSTYVEKATSTSKSTSTKKTSSTSTKSSSSTSTSESSSSSEAPSSSETSSTSADSTSSSATETETAAAGAAPAETSVSTKDAPAATPVGGIVGGVIGGIALIALAALGAVFLRKRKRENQETAAFAPTQHPMKESPFHTQQPPDPFAQQPPQSFSQQPPQPFSQQSPQSFSQQPPQSFSQQPPQSFSQQPAQPPFETYATPSAQNPSHMYGAPAAGAAAASAAGAYRSPSLSNRDPSPLSTPAASPGPQYQQPQPPAPSYYQSYHQPSHSQDFAAPAYQSYHQQPPRQSQDHIRGHGETWTGPGGAAEPIDRRSTSTPLSTYHGATPTTPASALNSMPGEQSMGGGGIPDVPLILQPGMGFRPYRPPSNSVSSTGPPTVVRIVASPPPVVVQQGPPQSQLRGQGQGQTQAQGAVAQPNPQSNSAPAIELP